MHHCPAAASDTAAAAACAAERGSNPVI